MAGSSATLKEGRILWIKCDVFAGHMPSELTVSLRLPQNGERVIRAFVPEEDVRRSPNNKAKGKVKAVVARVKNGHAAVMLRGEVYGTTNPVLVSSQWLADEYAKQVRAQRAPA